jgi:hypothetical protein
VYNVYVSGIGCIYAASTGIISAVKALKEKKGIQHHFDMAKMYGQKAFFGRSRHDCNRMIINAAVASYLAKICDDEI